ncbi:FUSC family protein [Streptomyces sp. AC563]|uniref:FUSC family protein n=1 Tax=Streptomyces buecherae TaxID=2763006 RepID=UPI00164D3B67|nr:aromatic acid exporter family protein [Streptomyces buecherae]MBC3987068.1 FUSC family protein [Streptomyces buecherae]MBC3991698.1 FUSC family protein [Streptomyces buecherae]QNJ43482.1 FUSC family protein [Streptomyces buecherae]
MPDVKEPVAELTKRSRHPTVVQAIRSTAAATISYAVALQLSSEPVPLTAPLTALLVVQVTLYATLTTGIRRVNAVVSGVLIAIAFSSLVGLSWWSLGLIILASLAAGHLVKVREFTAEVAISAMLVLGVTRVANTAWDRVLETLIGAIVGLLFNFLFAPPVWVRTASEHIEDLACRLRELLLHISGGLGEHTPVDRAAARLHEARRLDNDVTRVDAALRQAEDSLRLNPRVKEGLLHRVVLRTGLDTLEICTVVVRVLTRTLTDLAKHRRGEPLFEPEVADALAELIEHVADAVESFAVLVTTQVSADAQQAETRLTEVLDAAADSRERAARLLGEAVQADPRQWHLRGALLSEIDRMLDEMDMEHRTTRLMEELDRNAREDRGRFPRLRKLVRL